MIKIPKKTERLSMAMKTHGDAVVSYVKKQSTEYKEALFGKVNRVMPASGDFTDMTARDDWSWLTDFILADVSELKRMVQTPALLQFDEFKKLYSNRFSAGSGRYVDNAAKYNAYSFVENIGVTVCPYCDEEYLDIVEKEDHEKLRTLEIDHFFPKGKYPALAMCFFNLIPSGQNCNGIKLDGALGMNPFEDEIEQCTWLYPDLPVGVNMENVPVSDCTIRFHPKAGMEKNVKTLHLEERYERHKAKAHKYLLLKQQYDDSKVEEMVKLGIFPTKDFAYRVLYGEPLQDDGEQELLTKLKRDITGR